MKNDEYIAKMYNLYVCTGENINKGIKSANPFKVSLYNIYKMDNNKEGIYKYM